MSSVYLYVKDMFFYMLMALPAIVIFRVICVALLHSKSKKTSFLHESAIIIFMLFLVGLASQTIQPDFHISSENSDINLTLFRIFKEIKYTLFVQHSFSYFLVNFVGNIVIFMPIGFFPPLIWEKIHGFIPTVLIGFFISLFIELCQLALPRRTDVDDLWMNTLGTALGYIFFMLINKLFPKLVNKFKL